jgi:hypothetical protein
VKVVEVDDDPVQERASGIKLDRSHHPLAEAAEVAVQMEQEVDTRPKQEQPANDALERDQPQDAPAAGAVAS